MTVSKQTTSPSSRGSRTSTPEEHGATAEASLHDRRNLRLRSDSLWEAIGLSPAVPPTVFGTEISHIGLPHRATARDLSQQRTQLLGILGEAIALFDENDFTTHDASITRSSPFRGRTPGAESDSRQ
jgi:hypothetical protein